MDIDRRSLIALSTVAGALGATEPAAAAPAATLSALGIDAAQLGVRPGSPDDQTQVLQRAIDQAAGAHVPLVLPPGVYRAGGLALRAGSRLIGVRGATRLVLAGGPSLLAAENADHVALSGLVLDGGARPLPDRRGLVHVSAGRAVRIEDCEITGAGGHGLVLEQIQGEVTATTVTAAAGAAIFSLDARGLTIARNVISGAGNNGILVWRSEAGDDGTMVVDNRIDDVAARDGGSGQNGNAINVFRAGNVMVRGNRIRNAAFSAVRGNAASNLQITANTCTAIGEVALYAEFGFEGAVIAHNMVDGAALGVSVTNFNEGGRLAVVQGNLIRNLSVNRPAGTDPKDAAGIGIGVEADATITANLVENAPTAGIYIGFGQYLRDVAVTANVIRRTGCGIAVSVVPGAGSALISGNLIAAAARGAILGFEWDRIVTGDLATEGADRFAQLLVSGNKVNKI